MDSGKRAVAGSGRQLLGMVEREQNTRACVVYQKRGSGTVPELRDNPLDAAASSAETGEYLT